MRRAFVIVLVVLGVLGLAAIGAWQWWLRSPQYSLQQAAQAYRAHDWEWFQRYVDVDSLAEEAVDDYLAAVSKGEPGELEQGLTEAIRPVAVTIIRQRLRQEVESTSRREPALAVTPAASTSGGIDPKLGDVEREGDVTHADVHFTDGRGRRRTIELLMRRAEDHWRVAEIENLEDFLPDIQREIDRQIDESGLPD